jgi:hypothetical protein
MSPTLQIVPKARCHESQKLEDFIKIIRFYHCEYTRKKINNMSLGAKLLTLLVLNSGRQNN